jgi:hypothetical protein
MAVSIGNARVCKRSCLARFLVYLTRPGYILFVFAPGAGKRLLLSSLLVLALLCHSHVLIIITISPLHILKHSQSHHHLKRYISLIVTPQFHIT